MTARVRAFLVISLLTVPFHSLRLISPVIRDHGIDYERGKFQDKLDDGSLTLERSEVCDCIAYNLSYDEWSVKDCVFTSYNLSYR